MARPTIHVVGGGFSGLVAAISCAEAGAAVHVSEAAPMLGGRARTSTGEFHANLGPHVVYDDGPTWTWLDDRGLARPARRARLGPLRFVVDGTAHRLPPRSLVAAIVRHRRTPAPDDRDARSWLTDLTDERTAALLCAAIGVATFHPDPGKLAASFVWPRLVRVATAFPPATRYLPGGWATLIDRLADRARSLGVTIETGARVDRLDDRPTILAVPLRAASSLLDDPGVRRAPGTSTRVGLLDIGLGARRRRDPFVVSDLDHGGWLERFSAPDPSLAPSGHDLIQVQVGVADDDLDASVASCERLLDAACRDWRGREVWRRRSILTDSTGAVDLPGTTWRDRPAIVQRDHVWLAGDEVAAPGLLAEVALRSAIAAAGHAATAVDAPLSTRS